MGCNPQELKELTDLLSGGHYGETTARPLVEEQKGGTPGVIASRKKLGSRFYPRTMRAAFGDRFTTEVLNQIQMEDVKNEVMKMNHTDRAYQALRKLGGLGKLRARFGIPTEVSQRMGVLLEHTDEAGIVRGIEATDIEREAAKEFREVYNDGFKLGVNSGALDPDTYLKFYRPYVAKTKQGILIDTAGTPDAERLRSLISQKNVDFLHAYERTGMMDPDPGVIAGLHSYFDGLAKMNLKKVLDKVESEYVNDYFGVKFVTDKGQRKILTNDAQAYNFWLEYKDHLLGGPSKSDQVLTYAAQKLVEGLSGGTKTVSTRSLYQIANVWSSMYYGGVLGGPLGTRPASIIRHAFRLVPSFSEFGTRDFVTGFTNAVKAVTTDRATLERLKQEGMISSSFERLEDQMSVASKAGRAITETSQAFLSLFRASDQLWRASTALAAENRFSRFTNDIDHLPGRPELRERVIRLFKQGKIDQARQEYMFDHIAQLEYAYGKANRPASFRGALGQVFGLLQSYPINTLELYRSFGKRAIVGAKGGDYAEALPLLRQVMVASTAMYVGAEFLNADLTSVFTHGVMPHVPPTLDTAYQGVKATGLGLQAIVGNVFGSGEDQFHQRQRHEAFKEFGRSMGDFFPGSLAVQNYARVAEDGDIMRLLGFPPIAEIRDEQAKEHRREVRSLRTP